MGSAAATVEQVAWSVGFELQFMKRHTLRISAGALGGGSFTLEATRYALGLGATGAVAYSYLLVEPRGAVPFVTLAGSLAGSGATSRQGAYGALDLRVSVSAGWVLFDRFTPYAVARAFGGPVFFNGLVGGDRYHVQLGLGFMVGLPDGLDFSAEVIPLGEQSVFAGLGYSF